MMRQRVGLAALLAVALLCASLCVAGCASLSPTAATVTSTPSPSMTSLFVQRTSIYQRDLPAFETTSTRAAAITALATSIRQLVAANLLRTQSTLDDPSCALDEGIDYQLTFFQGQHIALRASFPMGGCGRVVLYDGQELGFWNGGDVPDVTVDGVRAVAVDFATFDAQFQAATGMSEAGEWNVSPITHPPYAPLPTFPTSLWPRHPRVFATVTPTP